MSDLAEKMRHDALVIWQAGVDAVRSDRLVRKHVNIHGGQLIVAGQSFDLAAIGRIAVVGAGKAGAGMAAGLETALGAELLRDKRVTGWINVPADCAGPLSHIHLHAARPAGVNEPTAEGVAGAERMLQIVGELGPDDLCVALISGGGSALLPLPLESITLDDKLAVTRFLSAAGAPIDELNTVRKQLSRIKGGGLARACRAGTLVALVISDVLGDPLDLIASGPTVVDSSTPADALAILDSYGARQAGISERVFAALSRGAPDRREPFRCQVTNQIIGNNATAVEAAGRKAAELGYQVETHSASASEGAAEDVGRELADAAIALQGSQGPRCLISGGEPTVRLVEANRRGKGGRNQQLALAAGIRWLDKNVAGDFLLLSGGTDGEDGPTDAAGAWVDEPLLRAAAKRGLEPREFLARNDAYRWFEPLGALVKTGPTHTNVCDVRVVVTA